MVVDRLRCRSAGEVGTSPRRARLALRRWRRATFLVLGASAVLAITGLAAPGAGAAGEGGAAVSVSVNGVLLQSESRVPGCAITVDVTGVGTGTHAVGVKVAAMEPSGAATVVDESANTATGAVRLGPYDMTSLVKTLGLTATDNGYHMRATVDVDQVQVASKPFWLACGRSQHAGHSVRMVFAVTWRASSGQTSPAPPSGVTGDFVLTATSNHGTATCSYVAGGSQLACDYPPAESTEGNAPPSLQVSGLGTYTVAETGIPPGWAPDPTTVGIFAANPTLPGAGTEHGDAILPRAPAVATHTVVNLQEPSQAGYRLAGADGSVASIGDATYAGSMGGQPLGAPVVGMAATPDGGGYWLVAADGGVFAFGDAGFHGSMGGQPLNEPVVGMAATPDGGGYWLVAADGGVFAFGSAGYAGSVAEVPSPSPVVAIGAA